MKKKNEPLTIGFFDSGLGGLTLVKEILQSSLHCRCVYMADTQNFPYGNQKGEAILEHASKGIHFLEKQNVDLIVVACHTVSAVALPLLKDKTQTPLLSIIPLSAEKTIRSTQTQIVGLMGTTATVLSLSYNQLFRKCSPNIKLFSKPFSALAKIIERESIDSNVLYDIIEDYFRGFFFEAMDTIILGCTHFAIFKSLIHKVVGDSVTLVDPATGVVDYLKNYCAIGADHVFDKESTSRLTLYVTRLCQNFEKKSQEFLNKKNECIDIRKISLESSSHCVSTIYRNKSTSKKMIHH